MGYQELESIGERQDKEELVNEYKNIDRKEDCVLLYYMLTIVENNGLYVLNILKDFRWS